MVVSKLKLSKGNWNKREDGSCPLKTGASRSKREKWDISYTNDVKELSSLKFLVTLTFFFPKLVLFFFFL